MDENREEKQKIWVSKAWLRRDKNPVDHTSDTKTRMKRTI